MFKYYSIFCLFFIHANGHGQIADTIYCKGDLETLVAAGGYYDFYGVRSVKDKTVTFYLNDNTKYAYFQTKKNRREGVGVFYHENGEILQKGNYRKNRQIGIHDYFDVTANYVRSEIYNRRGKIIAEYYKTISDKKIFTVCNQLSSFGKARNKTKAFMEMGAFIDTNLLHTTISEQLDEAIVTVTFLIAPDGSLEEIKIIQSVHNGLNDEVMEVMNKMPNWRPAKFKGKAVYSEFSITVNF